jgi:predicted Zn-dependent peptidase
MVFAFAFFCAVSAVEIAHENFTLENGLEVILIEDHRLPQVVVDVWYGVGSYDDPEGASGFAHLFEHLMFKGTELVPAFDPLMEANGGSNNATTGNDRTNYFSWGASNSLELLLFLEADRMTGLQITQEKLDMERSVVRNELRQNYEDAPYGGVWLALPEMLFPPAHPYSLEGIGSHKDLLNANLEHVQAFYRDWYAPNNARLAVAGDFDSKATKTLIETLFSGLQASIVPPHTVPPETVVVQQRRKLLQDRVSAPALVLAWHSPSFFQEGDADLDVLANVLAGHGAARLDARLVHGGGGAQETWAGQLSSQRGSTFLVWILGEPNADLAAIEAVVLEEIANLAGEELATEEELAIALNNREMGFLQDLEGLLDRAETLQSYAHYMGKGFGPKEDMARYKAVDSESIKGVIEAWLAPEKYAAIEVYPQAEESVPADEEAAPVEGGEL